MLDIDFLALEYDSGQPVALVEYKHEDSETQFSSHPSYRALINLGERADLPVFAVRYARDFSWWRVVPLNQDARHWVGQRQDMSEAEWVQLLYQMRGRDAPKNVLSDVEEI
jgi:hypothetical protein